MTDTEYKAFMVSDVKETGDYTELKIKKEDLGDFLHPENAYIIINQDIQRIYFWKENFKFGKKLMISETNSKIHLKC